MLNSLNLQFIGRLTDLDLVDDETQPLNQDPLLVNDDDDDDDDRNGNDGTGTGNIEGDEDEDGGDIAGPRVEAHVDLPKNPRTYCMTA